MEGKFAGYWAYGYTTFALDITPYLPKNGGKITPGKYSVAVHLKNREESNRWYPGAGLYRPVRLSLSQDVAVKTFGIFARTTGIEGINSDGTSAQSARITVTTALRTSNRQKIKVLHTLIGNGSEVAHTETDLSGDETTQIFTVNNPKLWSPEHPVLYVLETSIICND
mgnify:CR=1 FL=1